MTEYLWRHNKNNTSVYLRTNNICHLPTEVGSNTGTSVDAPRASQPVNATSSAERAIASEP